MTLCSCGHGRIWHSFLKGHCQRGSGCVCPEFVDVARVLRRYGEDDDV